jgi:hypothetical protein
VGGPGRLAGPRHLLRRLGSALVAVAAVLLLLALFGSAAYNLYAYQSGAPTTATNEIYTKDCVTEDEHRGVLDTLVETNPLFDLLNLDACTATWNVGAVSQTGPIVGAGNIHRDESSSDGYDQSPLDVRVFDGKAYTATSQMHSLLWATGIGVLGIAIAVVSWWRRRTGRSTRGWLGGIFEFVGDFFGDD